MYSKAKLLGHPIHPLLVGFPVALYSSATAAYLIYAITGDVFAFKLGVVANVGGVVSALGAAVPGFVDWAVGIPKGHPAKSTGLEHMLLNLSALVLFALDAVLQLMQWHSTHPAFALAVPLAAWGLGLTMAGVVLGWKMAHKQNIGVEVLAADRKSGIVLIRRRHPTGPATTQARHA